MKWPATFRIPRGGACEINEEVLKRVKRRFGQYESASPLSVRVSFSRNVFPFASDPLKYGLVFNSCRERSRFEPYEALRDALEAQRNLWKEHGFPACVELDVHKERIAVFAARCGRRDLKPRAEAANNPLLIRNAGLKTRQRV